MCVDCQLVLATCCLSRKNVIFILFFSSFYFFVIIIIAAVAVAAIAFIVLVAVLWYGNTNLYDVYTFFYFFIRMYGMQQQQHLCLPL